MAHPTTKSVRFLALLCFPLWLLGSLSGCDQDSETKSGSEETGEATIALHTTNGEGSFRFVGTLRILTESGQEAETVVAEADGPNSHSRRLAAGSYRLALSGGEFGQVLLPQGMPPYCLHEGALVGCSLVDPGSFVVRPGQTTTVALRVIFHLDRGDTPVVFTTGQVEVTLDPRFGADLCGGAAPCEAGQLCAIVEGRDPACLWTCERDADCPGELRCVPAGYGEAVEGGESLTGVCLDTRADDGLPPGDAEDGGLPADGEEPCTAVDPNDLPDDSFLDTNCDGIDGDVAAAIFVATSGSNANPGTLELPMATIMAGVSRAVSTGKTQVYVSEGLYSERITLANGVSIYGGYSQAAGWTRSATNVTTIRNSVVANNRVVAVEGSQIHVATTLDRLTIESGSTNVAGASSYAVHCNGCTAVVLKNSVVMAGSAGDGLVGGNGAAGAHGANGIPGGSGSCNGPVPGPGGSGGASTCGRAGGNGGRGGSEGANSGTAGGTGQIGTPGGNAGQGGNPGSRGGDGLNGTAGGGGTDGAPGQGNSIVNGYWAGQNGGTGATGTPGNGGGGGGGGGGQGCTFCDNGSGNGGGGGGSGGCGGSGGQGGTAGGGSFGVFLVSSIGFQLDNNRIVSSNGGRGGAGGIGGIAGLGGTGASGGASCTSEVGAGGRGGNGERGGGGGNGGGGAGGPSFAVYRLNGAVSIGGNTLVPGSGGLGGASLGNAGALGASGPVF